MMVYNNFNQFIGKNASWKLQKQPLKVFYKKDIFLWDLYNF